MKDLMLFGVQGSGKGTQAALLTERFGYVIFEAGRNLRKLAEDTRPLGQKVKQIIEAGHLVPDEVIMEIVEDFITTADPKAHIIFDGMPRTMSQARLFDAVMERVGRLPTGLSINLSDEEALHRLTSRRLCSKCKKIFAGSFASDACDACGGALIRRADDTPESITVRLQNFHTETTPVIDHYRADGRLIDIDGSKPMHEVTESIAAAVSA